MSCGISICPTNLPSFRASRAMFVKLVRVSGKGVG